MCSLFSNQDTGNEAKEKGEKVISSRTKSGEGATVYVTSDSGSMWYIQSVLSRDGVGCGLL